MNVPTFNTDQEAEDFLDQDLTAFLKPENFTKASFEFLPKTESVNLRMSGSLLDAIKTQAGREGIPYQKYIRMTLERALQPQTVP